MRAPFGSYSGSRTTSAGTCMPSTSTSTTVPGPHATGSRAWWCAWQTSKDGVPRVDTHPLTVYQQGELLQLDAERAPAAGSYTWRGELRLWDNEALMGWYRSTEGAVRSKGTMYLALHPHGEHAWGRWVGMSYDGVVVTGWGAIARTEEFAGKVVQDLINADES